jgi:hypothetical protein
METCEFEVGLSPLLQPNHNYPQIEDSPNFKIFDFEENKEQNQDILDLIDDDYLRRAFRHSPSRSNSNQFQLPEQMEG